MQMIISAWEKIIYIHSKYPTYTQHKVLESIISKTLCVSK